MLPVKAKAVILMTVGQRDENFQVDAGLIMSILDEVPVRRRFSWDFVSTLFRVIIVDGNMEIYL